MTDLSTIYFLRRGLGRIASGFCKNTIARYDENFVAYQWCAVGAVSQNREAVHALYPHLPEEFKITAPYYDSAGTVISRSDWNKVVRYNNHPDTTQADMVALFEKALSELGGLG